MNTKDDFERWAVRTRDKHDLPHFILKRPDGEYVDHTTTIAYNAWVAAHEFYVGAKEEYAKTNRDN